MNAVELLRRHMVYHGEHLTEEEALKFLLDSQMASLMDTGRGGIDVTVRLTHKCNDMCYKTR